MSCRQGLAAALAWKTNRAKSMGLVEVYGCLNVHMFNDWLGKGKNQSCLNAKAVFANILIIHYEKFEVKNINQCFLGAGVHDLFSLRFLSVLPSAFQDIVAAAVAGSLLCTQWFENSGYRRSVPSPGISDLASLTFQGSAHIAKPCAVQRLSVVCPFKSVSFHMEYCKDLLGQGAGMSFCANDRNTNLGLAATWVPLPAMIKTSFGSPKGLWEQLRLLF